MKGHVAVVTTWKSMKRWGGVSKKFWTKILAMLTLKAINEKLRERFPHHPVVHVRTVAKHLRPVAIINVCVTNFPYCYLRRTNDSSIHATVVWIPLDSVLLLNFHYAQLTFDCCCRAFALGPWGTRQQRRWRPFWCTWQKHLIKILCLGTPTWRLWRHMQTLCWKRSVVGTHY